jgi:thiol:disulfide interchange protein DsbA
MKKIFSSLLLAVLFMPFLAAAQDAPAEKYQAGTHYQVIAVPVRTGNPEKIEVNEVFAYSCPHCFHFEAVLEPWAKTLAADVDFQRTPAIWRPNMEAHARIYYAAKQLGVLDAMHVIAFKALQEEKKVLDNEDQVAALFIAHGIENAAIRKAYNSFSVQSLTKQGDARVRSYGVTGTPEIIVNGKYRVSAKEAGSQEAMVAVASFLIEKERRNNSAVKK